VVTSGGIKEYADIALAISLTLSNDALAALNQEISTKAVELETLYRRRLLAISTVIVDPPREILDQTVSPADASFETLRRISLTDVCLVFYLRLGYIAYTNCIIIYFHTKCIITYFNIYIMSSFPLNFLSSPR